MQSDWLYLDAKQICQALLALAPLGRAIHIKMIPSDVAQPKVAKASKEDKIRSQNDVEISPAKFASVNEPLLSTADEIFDACHTSVTKYKMQAQFLQL